MGIRAPLLFQLHARKRQLTTTTTSLNFFFPKIDLCCDHWAGKSLYTCADRSLKIPFVSILWRAVLVLSIHSLVRSTSATPSVHSVPKSIVKCERRGSVKCQPSASTPFSVYILFIKKRLQVGDRFFNGRRSCRVSLISFVSILKGSYVINPAIH